jgi:uncharacterized membrane protein HdeD (DUF308 family)
MFVCGILAMILPLTFSFGIAITIGCVVLVAGIAHFIFAFDTRNFGGFLWHMLLCALYGLTSIFLLVNPLLSLSSLVLLLAVFLLLEGTLELVLYFWIRRSRHSLWVLIDGVGTFVLGIVMVRHWPPASPDIIGVLVGISLMLTALSRVVVSLTVRALNPSPA